MRTKNILLIFVALMLTIVPALAIADQGDSDAASAGGFEQGSINSSEGGTIFVHIDNDTGSEITVNIKVENVSTGDEYGTASVTVPANTENYKAGVHVNVGSTGTFNVKITCESSAFAETVTGTISINVGTSVWSNWGTYLAIALVVILVVIALVVHSRGTPKIKPDITFTEIEGKKESDRESKKPAEAPTTEKKRYQTSKPAGEPPKKEEPKKAQNFTELEAEKKSAKNADSEKPEKLKYKSSRRK